MRKVSSIVVTLPTNLIPMEERKRLSATISLIINDLNHNVDEMKLIDHIPIEDPDLKAKASELI